MPAHKLVVVDPFENYKRGDQILDQRLVAMILDERSDIHHYERHVRRVLMSEIEVQQFIAPLPENKPPHIHPIPHEEPPFDAPEKASSKLHKLESISALRD